jgi:hypothetical protein
MPAWLKWGLVIAGGGFLVARGGLAVMAPLLRFALPLLAVYGVYKLVRNQLQAGKEQERFQRSSERDSGRDTGQTIQICSHCGQEVGSCKDCPAKSSS